MNPSAVCRKTTSIAQCRQNKYLCEHCSQSCRDLYDLKKHIKRVHEEGSKSEIECNLCNCKLRKGELVKHSKEKHGISIEKDLIKFSSKDEFMSWKDAMEKETRSKYVQHSGSKTSKSGVTATVYHCHRDGYFRPRGHKLRSLKSLGSNKINAHCPSCLVVKVKDSTGMISVEFTKTHLGHTLDVSRLSLSQSEKKYIASKIALEVPLDDILNEIKDSFFLNEDLNRIHLIKKKDLYNVIGQFKLKEKVDASLTRQAAKSEIMISVHKPIEECAVVQEYEEIEHNPTEDCAVVQEYEEIVQNPIDGCAGVQVYEEIVHSQIEDCPGVQEHEDITHSNLEYESVFMEGVDEVLEIELSSSSAKENNLNVKKTQVLEEVKDLLNIIKNEEELEVLTEKISIAKRKIPIECLDCKRPILIKKEENKEPAKKRIFLQNGLRLVCVSREKEELGIS